jgi:hypothetical protein
MNPNGISRGSSSTTKTTTINTNEAPKTLVLRLKQRKAELEEKKDELEKRTQNLSASMFQSPHGQEILSQSVLIHHDIQAIPTEASQSLEDSVLSTESDDDDEEEFFDCEDIVEDIRLENQAIETGIQVAENQAEQEVQLTTLQKIGNHLSDIANREGTTFASAVVTAGVAVTAPFAAPAIISTLLAIGAGGIAANEIRKMLERHVNDLGASDHLKAIENAIENIMERTDLATQSIIQAQNLQIEVDANIAQIEREMESLEEMLIEAEGELAQTIKEALGNLDQSRRALQQQGYSLKNAIIYAKKSISTLNLQREMLNDLLNAKYSIKNERDLQEVIATINEAISQIKILSDSAYEDQLNATKSLMEALNMQQEMHSVHRRSHELIGKIQALQVKLQEATKQATEAKENAKEAKEKNAELGEELKKQEQLNRENRQDLKVARDQLEQEKQVERFGTESIMYGGGLAAATGATLGFFLGGGVGTGAGAVGGNLMLGPLAVRSVHYARKFLRALKKSDEAEKLRKAKENIEKAKPTQNTRVSVQAAYGTSQGSLVGSYGAKSAWNLGALATNWALGREVASEWLSRRAGQITISIGNVNFTLQFDKQNANANRYGALTIDQQQNLSNLLIDELRRGNMTPQVVRTLLNSLVNVQIGPEVIMMINPNSPAMENLRNLVKDMLGEK